MMHALDDAGPDLTGQVALVTGAGRGVGRSIAEGLARAGAAVAVVSRSADQVAEVSLAIQSFGATCIHFSVDVTNRQAVDAMAQTVTQKLGPVDLLVNNAGSWTSVGPLWQADPDDWWRDVEINLRGTFLCTRAVLPLMVSRHRGRVINVASIAGTIPYPNAIGYACSKAAILRFSDSLAELVQEYSIRVFSISPGLVRTKMLQDVANSAEGRIWFPEFHEESADNYVSPERTAELVIALAAGTADRLTGRFIHVFDDLDDLLQRVEAIESGGLYQLRLRTKG
jgi:NAD(P)-dependent dehydrogenase (short-subunit alcohol dehydrogenase family)